MDNRETKNDNFVQLYREYMPEIRWLIKENPTASRIFLLFAEHMGQDNSLICSYEVIKEMLEISKSTIRRCIEFLKVNGFIDILKVGTANLYVLNHEVIWTTDNYKKEYAKMNSAVLVSRKENSDYKYRRQFERFKKLGIVQTNIDKDLKKIYKTNKEEQSNGKEEIN